MNETYQNKTASWVNSSKKNMFFQSLRFYLSWCLFFVNHIISCDIFCIFDFITCPRIGGDEFAGKDLCCGSFGPHCRGWSALHLPVGPWFSSGRDLLGGYSCSLLSFPYSSKCLRRYPQLLKTPQKPYLLSFVIWSPSFLFVLAGCRRICKCCLHLRFQWKVMFYKRCWDMRYAGSLRLKEFLDSVCWCSWSSSLGIWTEVAMCLSRSSFSLENDCQLIKSAATSSY